jgi:hypothetical protein
MFRFLKPIWLQLTSDADDGILFNSGNARIFFTPAVNKEENAYMCLGSRPRNITFYFLLVASSGEGHAVA